MLAWDEIPATHMNPAPPVTRIFLASLRGSNLVLPVRTGACRHSCCLTYDRGLRIVEPLRPARAMISARDRIDEHGLDLGLTLHTMRAIGYWLGSFGARFGGHGSSCDCLRTH